MKPITLLLPLILLSPTQLLAENQVHQQLDQAVQSVLDQSQNNFNNKELYRVKKKDWDKRLKGPGAYRQELNEVLGEKKANQVQSERFIHSIEAQVTAALKVALLDQKKSQSHFAQNIQLGSPFNIWSDSIERDGIQVSFGHGEGIQESKKIKASELNEQLKNFRQLNVQHSEFKILNAWNDQTLKDDFQNSSNPYKSLINSSEIDFLIAYDIRGEKSGKRVHLSGQFEVRANKGKEWSDLKISALGSNGMTMRSIERTPAFTSKTTELAFDKAKVYKRREALRRGGYALAVGDFNNDGVSDLYVGNAGKATLWKGLKNGNYEEVKSEASDVTLVKSAAFVDFNNNGQQDLIITRFDNSNLEGDILLFKNENGTFKHVKDAFASNHMRLYAMPMAIADFNNDGLLDVYVGYPGEKDFSMATYDSSSSTNRSGKFIHGVYLNKGKHKFADVTVSAFPDHSKYHTFPHGAVAADIDRDGDMDIVIMDDQKNLSPVLVNDGTGKFSISNNELNVSNFGFGMGVAVGDINNDGQPDVLMSNATFSAEKRIHMIGKRSAIKEFQAKAGAHEALRLFVGIPGQNKFYESTLSSGLTDVGEGAGGVTLIDYDNDGLEDIYVTNGLWSGTSSESIDSLFAQAQFLRLTDVDNLQSGEGENRGLETQSVYMKALIKDRLKDGKTLNFGGQQRNRLFKNLGNGKFVDVAYLEGVDSINDGYMSLVADLNNNGRMDLMLRNCDPGADDINFPVVEMYQNNHPNKNSLRLNLIGKSSNRDAIGAKAVAKFKDRTIVREVIASNSATQSERTLHFGLAADQNIPELMIYWPSGQVDSFKNIKAGTHTFTEKEKPAYTGL